MKISLFDIELLKRKSISVLPSTYSSVYYLIFALKAQFILLFEIQIGFKIIKLKTYKLNLKLIYITFFVYCVFKNE